MVCTVLAPTPPAPSTADLLALPGSLRAPIEAGRAEAEAARRFPTHLAETLRAAGAFRLTTPIERGGFEAPLSTLVDVYEAFGRIDGPAAWNVWNGNMGFCAALLTEEAGDEIWGRDGDPIIANSARVAGTATVAGDDLVLSGRWDIVSAIDIADWVALFGMVMDGDGPRVRTDRSRRAGVLPPPRGGHGPRHLAHARHAGDRQQHRRGGPRRRARAPGRQPLRADPNRPAALSHPRLHDRLDRERPHRRRHRPGRHRRGHRARADEADRQRAGAGRAAARLLPHRGRARRRSTPPAPCCGRPRAPSTRLRRRARR